ncbi:S49 family peptidase [Aminobacter niigataensis]|uniref:S49 family peptidase n=1 Tax=Aminobacter niigataensis TaxID=83265 RepID=UPI0024CC2157|nr:S49 family peptidase [Aminobacter niigataensis]CAI2936148.1 Peptidase S46 [Aminobacter niigataensis]
MSNLIHIADRVLNRPLLITRDKAQVILSVLSGRIGVTSPEASRFEGSSIERDEYGNSKSKPYRVSNGVAIITIVGSLVNRGAWIGASSGLTSYEGIGHQLKSASADDSAKAVILDMHTPGGEAVGAFETAELVRQLAAKKRTVAVVNGMAASAGYAIASAASEIVTTETGLSGSIGVVMLHADYSRALANEGIEPTLIFAGAHKVDGNPFEPLSADVKADLQKEVSAFYELFIKTVAKGRGSKLSAAAARKTEARIFMGQEAVEAGLADRVGSFETVLSELTRAVTPSGGRSTSQTRRSSMSEKEGAPVAEADAGIPKAEHDAAVKAAETMGFGAGTKAANERISAALGAEGVKGDATRMAAALDLAMKSPAMSGDDVAAFVVSNVSSSASSDPAAAYEASRVAGAGLAQPAPAKTSRRASLNSGDVYAARRQSVKEG